MTGAVQEETVALSKGMPRTAKAYFAAAGRDRERFAVRIVSRFVTRDGSAGLGEIGYTDSAYRGEVMERRAVGRVYWTAKGRLEQVFVEAGWANDVADEVKERARKVAAKVLEERDAEIVLWPTFMPTADVDNLARNTPAGTPPAHSDAEGGDMGGRRRTEMNEDGRKVWELLEGHFRPENAVTTEEIAKKAHCLKNRVGYIVASNMKFFPAKVKAERGKGYYLVGKPAAAPLPDPARGMKSLGEIMADEERVVGFSQAAAAFKITVVGPGMNVELEAGRAMALGVLRLVTGEVRPA